MLAELARMLLAVDIGNTGSKFAVFDGKQRRYLWRIPTDPGRTAGEYAADLAHLFASNSIALSEISGVAIASVVPATTPAVAKWARRVVGCEPLVVSADTDLGITVAYRPPGDVGADRLVDAVAALAAHGAPCIVIDFGTATTFNAVASARQAGGRPIYLGGAICPGIGLSLDAFFARAAKLAAAADKVRHGVVRPRHAIGDSTIAALESGIVFGYASQVQGMVARFRDELSAPDCPVIATGGDVAQLIADESGCITAVNPDLTLDGLRIVYERSQKGA